MSQREDEHEVEEAEGRDPSDDEVTPVEAAGEPDDDDEPDDDESDDDDEPDDDGEADDDDESDDDESDDGDESDDAAASAADEASGVEDGSGADEAPGTVAAAPDEPADADAEPELDTADAPPLRTILEAVLFAAAEPVPLARLVKLLGAWPKAAVAEALSELDEALAGEGRGIRVAETAGGLQLRSAADCAPWVRRFFAEKPPRLSRAVLETLAIVAYRQPATRGEVEAVRGVNCDAVLGALLTRNLIQVVGRRQSPGRPVEYGTTAVFLELFSLRDLGELPELPEPAALARLIEEAESQQEQVEDRDVDANPDGENPEDPEPGGDRVAEGGGGPDPGGEGPAEREGDLGAGDEGGPEQGPDHR